MTDKKCIWKMINLVCNGNITDKMLFSNQIEIPICEEHYKIHLSVMALHKDAKIDINEITAMDTEQLQSALKELADRENKTTEEILAETEP